MIDHPDALVEVLLSFSSIISVLVRHRLLSRITETLHAGLGIIRLLVSLLINRLLIDWLRLLSRLAIHLRGLRLYLWLCLDRLCRHLNRLIWLLHWLLYRRGRLLYRLRYRLYRLNRLLKNRLNLRLSLSF